MKRQFRWVTTDGVVHLEPEPLTVEEPELEVAPDPPMVIPPEPPLIIR